jgi:DNA-nicking Smr family endonuclease
MIDHDDDVFALPVDGVLDLHAFRPAEIRDLVVDYLGACRDKGVPSVRIIHGKGTGQLRRMVLSVLGRMDEVASFRTADEQAGGWGATVVELKPPETATEP